MTCVNAMHLKGRRSEGSRCAVRLRASWWPSGWLHRALSRFDALSIFDVRQLFLLPVLHCHEAKTKVPPVRDSLVPSAANGLTCACCLRFMARRCKVPPVLAACAQFPGPQRGQRFDLCVLPALHGQEAQGSTCAGCQCAISWPRGLVKLEALRLETRLPSSSAPGVPWKPMEARPKWARSFWTLHGRPENAGSAWICSKNGLETRVLSIQASGSAEIRASKPESATKQGVSSISSA